MTDRAAPREQTSTPLDDVPSSTVPIRLLATERRRLLEVARWSLEDHLGARSASGCRAVMTFAPLALTRPAAAFVTLRRADGGELRGCCGEIVARRPLIESVAAMAIAAAERDWRFAPVAAEELTRLTIGISVLGPLFPIAPEAVEVGRHGLLIRAAGRQGLLLPQVAVEAGWERERFLRGLCEKALLDSDAWRSRTEVELEAFEALSWNEAGPGDAHGAAERWR